VDGERPVTPLRRYQDVDLRSRIDGATPHALVAMLYGELQVALDVLDRAIATGDVRLIREQHERAASILIALESGLDRSGGSDIAVSLAEIYRQMRRRLLTARNGDAKASREVREGVDSLAAAWARIDRSTTQFTDVGIDSSGDAATVTLGIAKTK
jgi:flagellar secretion chaperone FliS